MESYWRRRQNDARNYTGTCLTESDQKTKFETKTGSLCAIDTSTRNFLPSRFLLHSLEPLEICEISVQESSLEESRRAGFEIGSVSLPILLYDTWIITSLVHHDQVSYSKFAEHLMSELHRRSLIDRDGSTLYKPAQVNSCGSWDPGSRQRHSGSECWCCPEGTWCLGRGMSSRC